MQAGSHAGYGTSSGTGHRHERRLLARPAAGLGSLACDDTRTCRSDRVSGTVATFGIGVPQQESSESPCLRVSSVSGLERPYTSIRASDSVIRGVRPGFNHSRMTKNPGTTSDSIFAAPSRCRNLRFRHRCSAKESGESLACVSSVSGLERPYASVRASDSVIRGVRSGFNHSRMTKNPGTTSDSIFAAPSAYSTSSSPSRR